MGRQNTNSTTDSELEILNYLWTNGPSTVRDVHDTLTKSRDIRYTTTLKTFQVMTAKGLVKRDDTQRAHVYEPLVDRMETQRSLVDELVDKAFNGSAVGLVASALSGKRATQDEIAEMRRLLDEAEEDLT